MNEKSHPSNADQPDHEGSASLWSEFDRQELSDARLDALSQVYEQVRERNLALINDVLGIGDGSSKTEIKMGDSVKVIGHGSPALELIPDDILVNPGTYRQVELKDGHILPTATNHLIHFIYAATGAKQIGQNHPKGSEDIFLKGEVKGLPVYFIESVITTTLGGETKKIYEVRVQKDEPTFAMNRLSASDVEWAEELGIPAHEAVYMTKEQLAAFEDDLDSLYKSIAELEGPADYEPLEPEWGVALKPAKKRSLVSRALQKVIKR